MKDVETRVMKVVMLGVVLSNKKGWDGFDNLSAWQRLPEQFRDRSEGENLG